MEVNQLAWVHQKKIQLIKSLEEIEGKAHMSAVYLSQENKKLKADVEKYMKQLQQMNQVKQSQSVTYEATIQRLENIVLENQREIERKNQVNLQLKQKDQENLEKISDLSKELEICSKNGQRQRQALQKQLNESKANNIQSNTEKEQQLHDLVNKYEQLLKQKQHSLEKDHSLKIIQIKQENQKIIQELQLKYKSHSQEDKKSQKQGYESMKHETNRLSEENRQFLSQINSYKEKNLDLQTSFENAKGQNKIQSKQFNLKNQLLRKELTLVHESEQILKQKNKELMDKNQALFYELKELEQSYTQKISTIKKTAKREFEELVEKSSCQVKRLQEELHSMKNVEIVQMQNQRKKAIDQIKQLQEKYSNLQKQYKAHLQQKSQIQNKVDNLNKTQKQIASVKQANLRKCQEISVLQEQIKRLKQKCNKLATATQDLLKSKQIMQRQNKMLLEEIIFLRQKGKKKQQYRHSSQHQKDYNNHTHSHQNNSSHSNILSINSEESRELDAFGDNDDRNDASQIEEYKQVISQLDKGMQQALEKVSQKDEIIAKQKEMIKKMEKFIAYGPQPQ